MSWWVFRYAGLKPQLPFGEFLSSWVRWVAEGPHTDWDSSPTWASEHNVIACHWVLSNKGKKPKQTRYASNLNARGQLVRVGDCRPICCPMMPWLFLGHCLIAFVIWFKGKRYFSYQPTLGDTQAERGAEAVSAFSEHISTKLFGTGDCVIVIHWESSWGAQFPPVRCTGPFSIVKTIIKQHACRHTT